MSYHFYPCGGRENFLKKGRQYSPQLLAPMDPGKMSTVNSGWNDPVLMKLPFVDHRNEPKWDSPTVNVLPSADSARALSARPFGSTKKPQLDNPPPMLPRTPLQSTGARSEHWYSDPIHGVFTNQVPEAKNRWTTSNRSVFRPRDGVQNSGVSARVLERLQASSNGSVSPSEHAKAYVRSCPLYDHLYLCLCLSALAAPSSSHSTAPAAPPLVIAPQDPLRAWMCRPPVPLSSPHTSRLPLPAVFPPSSSLRG